MQRDCETKEGECVIETSCPEARRATTRKNLHTEWLNSPEYKEQKRLFLEQNPYCEAFLEVGKKVPAVLAHHVNDWSYKSKALFCDLFHNGAMALSQKGHWCEHHNSKICPDCKKNTCNVRSARCSACEARINPVVAAELEKGIQEREDRKRLRRRRKADHKRYKSHPCKHRGTEQRCRRKTGLVCNFKADKAENCEHFKGKEAVV